jgi:hypothetical protein
MKQHRTINIQISSIISSNSQHSCDNQEHKTEETTQEAPLTTIPELSLLASEKTTASVNLNSDT